jgi:hypothetical protein
MGLIGSLRHGLLLGEYSDSDIWSWDFPTKQQTMLNHAR